MKELLVSMWRLEFVPCHRRRDRSFIISGKQFPICARCTGICTGYLFLIPIFSMSSANLGLKMLLALVCQLPLLIDGFSQYWKWRQSNNFLRFTTGLLSGLGQSVFIVAAGKTLIEQIFKWI